MDKYYVCLDIGGMSIKYGVLTEKGALVTSGAFPLYAKECGAQPLLLAVKQIVLEQKAQYPVAGVAIATAGIVDADKGIVLVGGAHFPGYSGTNWPAFIEKECGLPCAVENDVNALALGEYWQGAAQGTKLSYMLAMGTGIGGALLLEGKLIHGAAWSTGEVGYAHMGEEERWEDVASTGALVQQVAAKKNLPLEQVDGKQIFAWAQQGDAVAAGAIEAMVERWAEGIFNICYLVNPQQIILGGAIAAQEAYLRPLLLAKLKTKLLPSIYASTDIVFTKLEGRTALLGALYNFLQRN